MRSRGIILFLICLVMFTSSNAQDPQFSQFYANPLYTNPAFAGASGNYRFVISGRDQYTALQNNYKTAAASFDMSVPQVNGGLGILATTDQAGDGQLTTNTFSGIYSYQINVNRQLTFRAGIQGTYVQKSYNFNNLRFGDQIDDRYGFVNPTNEKSLGQQTSFPNFGVGFLAYTSIFYGGVAIHNITEPNQSFYFPNSPDVQYQLPRRYTAHTGLNLYLSQQRDEQERLMVSPNIIYMQQRNYNQLNLGFYVKKNAFTTGLWFRQTSKNSDAVIALIGVKFPKLRIGYSYDITVSGARTATQGSHELSIAIELNKKVNTRRISKPLICPAL